MWNIITISFIINFVTWRRLNHTINICVIERSGNLILIVFKAINLRVVK